MKLNLSVKEICSIIDGSFVESNQVTDQYIIQNLTVDSRSPICSDLTLFILLSGNKSHGKNFIDDFKRKGGNLVLSDALIKGSSLAQIIVNDPVKALQDLAVYHRNKFKIPVVGITGSNGKTTVKEWLYHVLKSKYNIVRSPKSYNSQIGVPLSVLEINESHNLAIFEAGISTVGEMENLARIIRPTIGVFTGLGDAHNDGFGENNPLEIKKKEKYKLFEDVEILIEYIDNSFKIHLENKIAEIDFSDYPVNIAFKDHASQINAKLVFALALNLGVDKTFLSHQLLHLPPISMRLEKLNGTNGNLLINDAYSLDAKSLEIGLQVLNEESKNRTAWLVIAEVVNVEVEHSLLNLVDENRLNLKVDKVVYFGSAEVGNHFDFVSLIYPTISAFYENPFKMENAVALFTGNRAWKLERVVNYYTDKKHITQLRINLSAIRKNLNIYRNVVGEDVMLLGMVKAQSYGGGIVEMARFLVHEGVNYLGVAYADEGVSLRKAGIDLPIIVMNPEKAAFGDMIDFDLEPSIYSNALLNSFIHQLILKEKQRFPVHIKLDTGMNRLGFRSEDLNELTALLNAQPEVFVKSCFSHLAVADDFNERAYSLKQIAKFRELANTIETKIDYPIIRHIANSAGALHFPEAHFDMVRLGIGMFGLLAEKNKFPFQNALELTSEISQIRSVHPGESIGYGRSFIANDEMRVAVVPIGYGDGLRRQLSNHQWSVVINGQFYPIIGKICMDMCMIDLKSDKLEVGDAVQIFGNENSIFEMARILDTIPYEIISTISSRVQRVYFEE